MIKKKLSFLLLLLLAVLFIGLFSTSYAVTESEFKNLIYNSLIYNNNMTSSDAEHIINNQFDSKFASVSQYFNDNYYIFFSRDSSNSTEINAWVCSVDNYGSSSHRTYNVTSSQLSACGDACRIRVTYSSNTLNILLRYRNNAENVTPFVYATSQTIFGNSNATIINHSADNDSPYYSSDWFTFSGPYSDYVDKFEFSPTSNYFSTASIDGLSTPNNVYVYNGQLGILTLGYLEKFSNLSHIYKVVYRYSKSTGWYELNASVTDNFDNYNIQDDILTYTVDLSNLRTDTLLLFSFQPNSLDFNNQDFWLYLKSPYTYISNGIIYPSQTFSGDYYNNYNDDSNTDKITDNNTNDTENITDTLTDDSQVDNILGSNLSGDNLLNNIGYNPIQNPFSTIILNTMTNFTDALLGSGSQTLSFTIFNNTISISSDDFVLPNGELRNFISLICNGFLVYQIIKYGFQLYQWINTGRIQNLVNEANNHQYYLF